MTVLKYPFTRQSLADALKLRPQTLRARLREIGVDHTNTLSVKEVKRYIEHYDIPSWVKIEI